MNENDNIVENQLMDEEDKDYKIEVINEKDNNSNINNYKVIILGLTGVGKTTISFRVVRNEFIQSSPTISLDVVNYQVKVNDKKIKIQLWDTCGNDEFAKNTPNLFKNTTLAIIVYAINDRQSFNEVGEWYNILREKSIDSLVYLIGNKIDLEKERKVTKDEGEELKKQLNFNYFLETSSKTGFNIKQLINKIAIFIYEKDKNENLNEGNKISHEDLRNLEDDKKKRKKKECCH